MKEFAVYDDQMARPIDQKVDGLHRDGQLKHIIFGSQLTPQFLTDISRDADRIRKMARSKAGNRELRSLLAHKRAMLYFTQPSTRTFLSFMAACQILGITCNEVRNPETSSEVKRESRMDGIRMFSSYFDVIIMRSKISNFAECCAYMMHELEQQKMRSVPIINAGAGSDEHPTQALLDMYTILRTFDFEEANGPTESRLGQLKEKYSDLTPGPAGKTYLFCGDIGRGRTVRSLASVLAQYSDTRMFFVSPQHEVLKLGADLRERLVERGVEVHEFNSLDTTLDGQPILAQADCFYMTRIQREHNSESTENEIAAIDLAPFQLSLERVNRLKEYCPILHPFPRDSVVGELPVEVDADPRAMYFRQARNGMWARAALLVHMFGAVNMLGEAYESVFETSI